MSRHARDAGGDPGLLAAKAQLRDEMWSQLDVDGVRRFPGPRNRIPNFVGAEAAAERLRATSAWDGSAALKANPDSPQWPARQRALEDGKIVFMAVPRLAEPDPFFLLDPHDLADGPRRASSIAGAARSARTVALDEVTPVELVLTGCVAVSEDGTRLGKGGGFSDLELAIATEAGLVDAATRVATTVHARQLLPSGTIPSGPHDLHVDLIATPDGVLEVPRGDRPPARLAWEQLTEDKIAAIPLLGRLRTLHGSPDGSSGA